MADFENTVAAVPEGIAAGTPADDAQAAEAISVEEIMASMLGEGNDHETAEETGAQAQTEMGDGGPDEPTVQQGKNDKFGKRISAALASQKEQIFKSLGMSEADVRELIRAHKAEQMHREDPEISPKAARKILEAQEKATQPAQAQRIADLSAEMKDMLSKGYTADEIREMVSDADVLSDIESGKNLWQAARAFERRRGEASITQRKRAPRTARSTAAGDSPEPNLIASIPDDKYDAFMENLRRRAMRGEKVRL